MGQTLVLGRDNAARLVGEHSDVGQYGPFSFRFYLTDCCLADATGTTSGVACRGCYTPLPDKYGGQPDALAVVFGDGLTTDQYRAVRS